MKLVILMTLAAGTFAVPMFQSVAVKDDGSYKFAFETGKEGGSHSRTEERDSDGKVTGKYSYEDPNGAIREVIYKADSLGYVANGDVSVEGAPKGQFPVPDLKAESTSNIADTTGDSENFKSKTPEPEEKAESHDSGESHKDDDIQDLSLEDSTINDPPEAFPSGFFLQQFQGLRRLPEPTKEETTSTTESAIPELSTTEGTERQSAEPVIESGDVLNEEHNKINRAPTELFMNMRPFQDFHSAHWAAPSMFHQPVYVFAYQHPESYGYHYYY